MTRSMARSQFELPRSTLGRAVFAVVCLGLIPVGLFLFYVSVFDFPAPQTLGEWIVAIVVGIVFELLSIGLLGFTFFGLIWSLFGSERAARLLQTGFRKLSYTVVSMTIVFWSVFALLTIVGLVRLIK